MHRITSLRATVLLVASVSLPGLTLGDERADGSIVPAAAGAFVTFDAIGLSQSPNLEFATKLLRHVLPETSQYSVKRLGVDVTKLVDVTFVFPALSALNQHDFPGVVVTTFADEFQQQCLVTRLQSEFGLTECGNDLFATPDLAIYLASPRTVVWGPPSHVAWWKKECGEPGHSELVTAFVEGRGKSHLFAGVSIPQVEVPMMFLAVIPATLVKEAEVVTCSFTLDDMARINAQWRFTEQQSAANAIEDLDQLVMQAKSMLGPTAAKLEGTLTDDKASTADGFGALAGLALVRQGRAYLDGIATEQRGNSANVAIEVDNELWTTVMICLTSIQSIGTHANQEFQEIADQLQER